MQAEKSQFDGPVHRFRDEIAWKVIMPVQKNSESEEGEWHAIFGSETGVLVKINMTVVSGIVVLISVCWSFGFVLSNENNGKSSLRCFELKEAFEFQIV